MKGHPLRGDAVLKLRGVAQAVCDDQLGHIASVRGDHRAPGDDPRHPGGERRAASVAAAHSLPVAPDDSRVLSSDGGIVRRGTTRNVCAAVRCGAIAVRAVQPCPRYGRRRVGMDGYLEVLIGRQSPAVCHRAAHRGGGAAYGFRAVWAFGDGFPQIGNAVSPYACPLLAGDPAVVKLRPGLGIALHPRPDGACLGAAVVVGHRRPAGGESRLHAPRHRSCKGYGLAPDQGAPAIGHASQCPRAAGVMGDLRRQALRQPPHRACAQSAADGSGGAAEAVGQRVGEGAGGSGQTDGHLLANGGRSHRRHGCSGDGGQFKALRRGIVVSVAIQPPGKCRHGKGF